MSNNEWADFGVKDSVKMESRAYDLAAINDELARLDKGWNAEEPLIFRVPNAGDFSFSAGDFRFQSPDNQPVVTFYNDGQIEFGEKYRNNPDAAAQEFMRIVREQWPSMWQSTPSVNVDLDLTVAPGTGGHVEGLKPFSDA